MPEISRFFGIIVRMYFDDAPSPTLDMTFDDLFGNRQQFTPPFPSDPQDRLITATAIAEGLPLVTADEAIRAASEVRTIW